MSDLNAVLSQIDTDQDAALERLFELLRIESISTDPAYKEACKDASDLLVADLNSIGFKAERRDTEGHPMVVAHSDNMDQTELPHFLFYGHYDVQPVDPLNLWNSAPFDPQLEDSPNGKVSVVDGKLPARITIFFEGEEESGSPSLVPFLEENRDELTADFAFVCDTGMWDAKTPAITTMLRGMVAEEMFRRSVPTSKRSGTVLDLMPQSSLAASASPCLREKQVIPP